jgi:hypothetical protein
MTLAEYRAEGERRFGPNMMNWKFVCPVCGHVASVQDYKDAGAPENAIAFSCVGRWAGVNDKWLEGEKSGAERTKPWGPCDYAGGGFFPLNPLKVEDGAYFDFAESEAVPT